MKKILTINHSIINCSSIQGLHTGPNGTVLYLKSGDFALILKDQLTDEALMSLSEAIDDYIQDPECTGILDIKGLHDMQVAKHDEIKDPGADMDWDEENEESPEASAEDNDDDAGEPVDYAQLLEEAQKLQARLRRIRAKHERPAQSLSDIIEGLEGDTKSQLSAEEVADVIHKVINDHAYIDDDNPIHGVSISVGGDVKLSDILDAVKKSIH